MCLKLHIHQTDCNTQSIVHLVRAPPEFTYDLYHPFDTPQSCRHTADYEYGDCEQHGQCCVYSTQLVCDRYVGLSWFYCLGELEVHLTICDQKRAEVLEVIGMKTIPLLNDAPRMDAATEAEAHRILRAYIDEGVRAREFLQRLQLEYPREVSLGTRRAALQRYDPRLLKEWEGALQDWNNVSLNRFDPNGSNIDVRKCYQWSTNPTWYRLFKVPGSPKDGDASRGNSSSADDDDNDSPPLGANKSYSPSRDSESPRNNSPKMCGGYGRTGAPNVLNPPESPPDSPHPESSASPDPLGIQREQPSDQPSSEGWGNDRADVAPSQGPSTADGPSSVPLPTSISLPLFWYNYSFDSTRDRRLDSPPQSPRGTMDDDEPKLPWVRDLLEVVDEDDFERAVWNMPNGLPGSSPHLTSVPSSSRVRQGVPQPVEPPFQPQGPPNPFFQAKAVPLPIPRNTTTGSVVRPDADWTLNQPVPGGFPHHRNQAQQQDIPHVSRPVTGAQANHPPIPVPDSSVLSGPTTPSIPTPQGPHPTSPTFSVSSPLPPVPRAFTESPSLSTSSPTSLRAAADIGWPRGPPSSPAPPDTNASRNANPPGRDGVGNTVMQSAESPAYWPTREPSPQRSPDRAAPESSRGKKRRRSSSPLSPLPRESKLRTLSEELCQVGGDVVGPKRRFY